MRRALLLLASAVVPPLAATRESPASGPAEIVLDRDDIDVTGDVVVRPGTYRVEDRNGDGVLRVRAAGATVTLAGVVLDGSRPGASPDAFQGVGVSVEGRLSADNSSAAGKKGVAIVGGAVRGFRTGLRAERAPGIRVEGLDASGCRKDRLKSTPEREDASDWLWPHENDGGEWERRYGAGISLTDCPGATVASCRVRGGQNGVLLARCDGSAVFDGDFSFDSGWGVALWRSSRCEVSRNRCDWCVRGYSHGVYARGQDSAGILVFEQCSDNLFAHNSATHSGDGFFLYAGHETLRRTGKGGCNRNRLVGNDFSHAVANAVEATFSEGNELVGNRFDDSEHGVWAGYSRKTTVRANSIEACRNGVSIEHGSENRIEGNAIRGCDTGVRLWADPNPEFEKGVYGTANETRSRANAIAGNEISGGTTGVRIANDADSSVEANAVVRPQVALRLGPGNRETRVVGNSVEGPSIAGVRQPAVVHFEGGGTTSILPNWWGGEDEGPSLEGAPLDFKMARPLEAPPALRPAGREVPPVATRGRQDATLPLGALRGRRFILVDEWGPVDPSKPTVFPRTQAASGEALLHVLGAGTAWKVVGLTRGLVASPTEGTGPATVRIRAAEAASGAGTLRAFEARVRLGETDLVATGTLLSARWRVRWHAWTKDPREDAAAWAALVAGTPAATAETDALDFSWAGGAPHPDVAADRFATVATTTLALPAGRYRVRTTSDDGVRVRIDGKTVLEDWTWHAPKEDAAVVDLAAGLHEVVVEHFEIDGWAALRASVEPAR